MAGKAARDIEEPQLALEVAGGEADLDASRLPLIVVEVSEPGRLDECSGDLLGRPSVANRPYQDIVVVR